MRLDTHQSRHSRCKRYVLSFERFHRSKHRLPVVSGALLHLKSLSIVARLALGPRSPSLTLETLPIPTPTLAFGLCLAGPLCTLRSSLTSIRACTRLALPRAVYEAFMPEFLPKGLLCSSHSGAATSRPLPPLHPHSMHRSHQIFLVSALMFCAAMGMSARFVTSLGNALFFFNSHTPLGLSPKNICNHPYLAECPCLALFSSFSDEKGSLTNSLTRYGSLHPDWMVEMHWIFMSCGTTETFRSPAVSDTIRPPRQLPKW